MTLSDLATEAKKHYRTSNPREEREGILVHTDDAPEWVTEMTQDAHVGLGFDNTPALPDDLRFEYVVEALDAIADHEDEDEARDSLEADVYTHDLLKWVSSHLGRKSYCDMAGEEGLLSESADMDARLSLGQVLEKQEVFDRVLECLRERLDCKSETEAVEETNKE
jgi:hypothetical protein